MKRKAKKHAGSARKGHVLSEAELKKIAAGWWGDWITGASRAFTDAPGRLAEGFENTYRQLRDQGR